MRKLCLIFFITACIGCMGNIRSNSAAVVDLPVVVKYSAEMLNEKNQRNFSKEELLEFVNNVITSVAKEKGYAMILNKTETVIYYNEDLDVTSDVISEINKRVLMNSKSGK